MQIDMTIRMPREYPFRRKGVAGSSPIHAYRPLLNANRSPATHYNRPNASGRPGQSKATLTHRKFGAGFTAASCHELMKEAADLPPGNRYRDGEGIPHLRRGNYRYSIDKACVEIAYPIEKASTPPAARSWMKKRTFCNTCKNTTTLSGKRGSLRTG